MGEAGASVWPLLSAAKLGSARRLLHAKVRQTADSFLVEGPQGVREALAYGDVRLLIVGFGATAEATSLGDDAAAQSVAVVSAEERQLASLTDTVHSQGVIAVCQRPPALGLGAPAQHDAPRLVLVLDELRDPGNVGALIRTADAAGAAMVVATPGTADIFSPKVVRATAGSIFHLPIVPDVPFEQALDQAERAGLRPLGTAAHGRWLNAMTTDELARPTAWFVGNEAHGLPPAHLGAMDDVVAVPIWGKAESLNVTAAAAVCLYASAQAQHRPSPRTSQ